MNVKLEMLITNFKIVFTKLTATMQNAQVASEPELKGNCTSNQKLACLYIYLSYSKLSTELQNGIEMLVPPAVFKL